VVSFIPAALSPGKEPLVLGGPQNHFGHGNEEKNSQPLPRCCCLINWEVSIYPAVGTQREASIEAV